MQKDIFTRIKIAIVKFRDTYFTGVQRIFRYSQRLETKLDEIKKGNENLKVQIFDELENKIENSNRNVDELKTLHFALNSEVQNLKKELTRKNNELKSTLEYAKINQALMNLEEKFTRKKDFDLNTFILFDYSNHIHRNYHNLGDFVQSIAVKRALESFSYSQFKFFDRDSLSFYPCYGGGLCIMQGWFSLTYDFLPPPNILPVFVGTHLIASSQSFLKHFVVRFPNYFKDKEIGCRDKFTLEFCQKLGVKSYFSRCLTLSLPKREAKESQNKIFLVNLNDEIKALLPETITKNSVEINQRGVNLNSFETFSQEFFLKHTEELLNRYKNEAKLIITTALHCAAPCVAMGIPVVLIMNDYKEQMTRFSALEGILSFYTLEDLKQNRIDFNPKSLDIEELKENLLLNLKRSIAKAKGETIDENELQNLREKIANFNILGVKK